MDRTETGRAGKLDQSGSAGRPSGTAGAAPIERQFFFVPNGAGSELALKRVLAPDALRPDFPPLAIVPGYGMNAFIFGYHPSGLSMEDFFARAGFEVWSVNLRDQGPSVRCVPRERYGMAELAIDDLGAAFRFVAERTRARRGTVDAIGCSLGGSYLFAQAGLGNGSPLGKIVAIGAPLRWEDIHPLLRFAFGAPGIAGSIPFRGTRALARLALPLLVRFPFLLRIYLHPEIVDTSRIDLLTETVEDPIPEVNREIARWIATGDMRLRGRSVTEAFSATRNPLLAVIANADGVVPEASALSALRASAAPRKDVLRCGTRAIRLAHADLFVSRYAQDLVFRPIAEWLEREGA